MPREYLDEPKVFIGRHVAKLKSFALIGEVPTLQLPLSRGGAGPIHRESGQSNSFCRFYRTIRPRFFLCCWATILVMPQ
jgi:hypothetical protein